MGRQTGKKSNQKTNGPQPQERFTPAAVALRREVGNMLIERRVPQALVHMNYGELEDLKAFLETGAAEMLDRSHLLQTSVGELRLRVREAIALNCTVAAEECKRILERESWNEAEMIPPKLEWR